MHPWIGLWPSAYAVRAYDVLYALSALCFAAMALRLTRRQGLPAPLAMDLSAAYVLAMTVGATLAYDLVYRQPWSLRAFRLGGVIEGGLYGGPAIALALIVALAASMRWPVSALDMGTVCLALGLTVAKLGCLMHGCCYGRPTGSPWAMVFPPGSYAPAGVPLVPTQALDAALLAATALVLGIAHLRQRARPGWLAVWFVLLFCAGRFVTEFGRDEARSAGLTMAQWALLAGLFGAAGLLGVAPAPWARLAAWLDARSTRRAAPVEPRGPRLLVRAGASAVDAALVAIWAVAAGPLLACVVAGIVFGLAPLAMGATPGMRVFGLRVVAEFGARPRGRALLRGALLPLSVLSLFGCLRPLFDPQRRALHDVLSGTRVVPAAGASRSRSEDADSAPAGMTEVVRG